MKKEFLIIMAGLPGTGKTTSAEKIAESLENYALIDQNEIRRNLGMKKLGKTQEKILRIIDRRINDYLSLGKGVIVDSVHRYGFRRQQLYGIASGCGTNVVTIETLCSEDEAKRRMSTRSLSDGLISDPRSSKIYDRLSRLWEDISADFKYPGENHVSYISFDTEKKKIYKYRVTRGMANFVNQIKSILLKH